MFLSAKTPGLEVTLGQWPRVQVGHLAVMKFGVLLPDVIVFEPTELSAVITTTTPQAGMRLGHTATIRTRR